MAALADLSDELSQTHAFIRAERQAIFTEDLDRQREATLEALTAERIAAIEALRSERIDTLKELERLTADFNATALRTIDHIFLRLVQVMLGLILIVFLLSKIAYWLLSRRRAV
jgi:hypothetical protein